MQFVNGSIGRTSRRWCCAAGTILLVVGMVFSPSSFAGAETPSGTGGAPAAGGALGSEDTSAIKSLMSSVVDGAASEFGGDLVGWVLGSAGATDGDAAVLGKISDQLTQIEDTLTDIESELKVLLDAINTLDCDSWVQETKPHVDAINNLWNVDATTGGQGAPPPEQSYVGIVSETKNNTVTTKDLQSWVDRVLNNFGQGEGGESIQDHLNDLGNLLLPAGGGQGVLESCLKLADNAPSNYTGYPDSYYYQHVVIPLTDYYYGIQAKGVTMVVEALNFEAWVASGSPTATPADITELPATICGGQPDNAVQQYCENAQWAVVGETGDSGVRARIAEQLTLGGAGYTEHSTSIAPGEEEVHRYMGSTTLWASDPERFNAVNSTNCTVLDSNAPCGILAGTWADSTIGGTYNFYGDGFEGTWRPANGSELGTIFSKDFSSSYGTAGAFMEQERAFKNLPDNTIFLTPTVFEDYPYGTSGVAYFNAIAFTDTGLKLAESPPVFNEHNPASYINLGNSLQVQTSSKEMCHYFDVNSQLPPRTENRNFYAGSAEFCQNDGRMWGAWTAGPPGWTADPGPSKAQRQFRLPVLDVTDLHCTYGVHATNPAGARSMCGEDFQAWLENQVPPALTGAPTIVDCKKDHPVKLDGQRRGSGAVSSRGKAGVGDPPRRPCTKAKPAEGDIDDLSGPDNPPVLAPEVDFGRRHRRPEPMTIG